MKDFANIALFVRVVRAGSFSAAARETSSTPSSVSRQISQLEEELGTRLFQRTTRKQALTEAGSIYYEHAQRILSDHETAKQAVNRLTNNPSGTLSVSAEADFAHTFIATLLPEFMQRYPDIKVNIVLSTHFIDLVDGGVDLAIRIGHLSDSSVIARKLTTSDSKVLASAAYLEAHGTPTHPTELSQHNCCSFQLTAGPKHWRFRSDEGLIEVPIAGNLNVNSVLFLKRMALASQGIVMLPSWTSQAEINSGELIPILDNYLIEPHSTPIQAVFAHNRHLAPKVRVFVDFLAEKIRA